MKIRFWGVRGSLPMPGPTTVRYGGNTICIEVRLEDKALIIIDAGTGIRGLGQEMSKTAFGVGGGEGHILLSHYHLDHVHGLPFFAPFYVSGNRFTIYGPPVAGSSLKDVLGRLMELPYFPYGWGGLKADFSYHTIEGDHLMIGVAVIKVGRFSHFGSTTLGYRIEEDGASFLYASDLEHPEGKLDEKVVELARGVGLLVHEAHFTPEEKARWKVHSTADEALSVALSADAKRLALIHHKTDRGDDELDNIVADLKHKAKHEYKSDLQIMAAYEGLEIDI